MKTDKNLSRKYLWLKRILIAAFGAELIFNPITFHYFLKAKQHLGKLMQNKASENSRQYVKNHLEDVMKEQEEKLGIKHVGIPEMGYTCDPEFKGHYDSERNEIDLDIEHAVTPEGNLSDVIAKYLAPKKPFGVKIILDHELGHFYMDKLEESRGLGNWPPKEYFEEYPQRQYLKIDLRRLFSKSIDILSQQVAVVLLVMFLGDAGLNLNQIILIFAVIFGLVHAPLIIIERGTWPSWYFTIFSILSAVVFPTLILKVQYGFVNSYIIHLVFYTLTATGFWILHRKIKLSS